MNQFLIKIKGSAGKENAIKTSSNSDSYMAAPYLTSPLNQTTPYRRRRLAGALCSLPPSAELFKIFWHPKTKRMAREGKSKTKAEKRL